ncbi:FkbM family methyltransferase [Sporolactobacillus sp. CPB3-1]|uniref:FkbM family methyltransferase n=1 Tax=Sporolactobacillus mangiferae TaxID=2940498 RepID=A0ABT0MC98_9BACL|nr:FkbM family methyltransferase [Sporolactobacillus mangiferae]MCL1632288.1 FkbM family methyltransferase [Sporolactobacillus mangiferae]
MNSFIDLLKKKDGMQNYYQQCVESVSHANEIVLFGCGRGGRNVFDLFAENGINKNVVAFCDNNADKQGTTFLGLDVFAPAKAANQFPNAFYIISCVDNVEPTNQLIDLGIKESHVTTFDFTWNDSKQTNFEYIMQHVQEFETVYHLLADDLSKRVYVNLLNYKITREQKYLNEIFNPFEKQYFNDLVPFKKGQVFVDVGAYVGDTLESYVNWSQGNYGKVYCFEPNVVNYQRLNQKVRQNDWHDVLTYQLGISKSKNKLFFDPMSPGGGFLSNRGTMAVPVDTLDHFLNNEQVDFIKLDLEGEEYNALAGGKNLIQKYRPVLAVCVYHKKDDFYQLVRYIKELCPDYQLYFRHYSLTEGETVCYALPK